jgi:hypothetical protein
MYRAPDSILNIDMTVAKGLFAAVNCLFLIAWSLASAFNKASISDMDYDPEELEEGET